MNKNCEQDDDGNCKYDQCKLDTCTTVDKNCKCYARQNTPFPEEEQVCGYFDAGVFYECEKGCCAGGCPDPECSNVILKNPEGYLKPDTVVVKLGQNVGTFKFDSLFAFGVSVVVLFIALAIIAIASPALAVLLLAGVCTFLLRNLKSMKHNEVIQRWPLLNLYKLLSPVLRRNSSLS